MPMLRHTDFMGQCLVGFVDAVRYFCAADYDRSCEFLGNPLTLAGLSEDGSESLPRLAYFIYRRPNG